MCESTPSAWVFAGWHNDELFAILLTHRSWFLVSAGSSHRFSITIGFLLLMSSPAVIDYYSGLALDHGYGPLIDVITSSESAVCTLMTFLHVASSVLTDNFQSNSRFQPGVAYSMALSSSVIGLVDAVGSVSLLMVRGLTGLPLSWLEMLRSVLVGPLFPSSLLLSCFHLLCSPTQLLSSLLKALLGLCSRERMFF